MFPYNLLYHCGIFKLAMAFFIQFERIKFNQTSMSKYPKINTEQTNPTGQIVINFVVYRWTSRVGESKNLLVSGISLDTESFVNMLMDRNARAG